MYRCVTPLSLLLLLFTAARGLGQYEKLLNKTYAQRHREIGEVYLKAIGDADSISAFEEANTLRALAVKSRDSDLELEMDLLKAYYLTIWYKKETALIPEKIKNLRERALALHNRQINARAIKVLADYYWAGLSNYELGFETYIVLEQALKNISSKELPDKIYALQNMAMAYHNFSDYRKALSLFDEIINLEVRREETGGENSAMFSSGAIYRQLGKLDSSDYFYNRILRNTSSGNYETWKGIANGGLGQNCYLRGEYKKAVPLLQADVDQALKNKDYGLAAGSMITLADIFLKQHAIKKAEQYAFGARRYLALVAPERYKHHQEMYSVLSKLSMAQGMPERAGSYLDSAIFAKDSLIRAFNAMQMIRAHQKIELQQHRLQVEKVESEKQRNIFERNMLIVIVFFATIGFGYFIYNLRRRHTKQQLQKAQEIRIKEQELENAVRELNVFANNISEKSQLIEKLEIRQGLSLNESALSQLRDSTILTQSEWEGFKKLFDTVHVGYLFRLKQKFPDLTQAEIRFIALAKLGLNYQEMASTLGIGSHAVRATKNRLIRKINMADYRSLEEFMVQI